MQIMWADIAVGSVIFGLAGMLFRFQHTRINKIEKGHKEDLYQSNGQTNYITRKECDGAQKTFCTKIDELKGLLITMEQKREATKDTYFQEQRLFGERLAGIEAKLP